MDTDGSDTEGSLNGISNGYVKSRIQISYDEGLKVGLGKVQSAIFEPERKALARKEMDLGNSAYIEKDFDTAIELSDEDISFLLNRALTYLKMGQVCKLSL